MNHVMRCPKCHPPTKRYCLEGVPLSDRYIATYLMTQDLYERRVFVTRLEASDYKRCEAIKALLLELHDQAKQAAA
ncbi:hypothetical protein [Pseudomonas gingeri]|uniref:hypothetical protein n=1 Tax=Pseudomonas gingeri TaxID=117681 RepID=UPI0015A14A57|nr:hypothetical protein [Pseudomonas gingeri]NWA11982.1 hypothetical protein [Pseudomonas gingeri]